MNIHDGSDDFGCCCCWDAHPWPSSSKCGTDHTHASCVFSTGWVP